jgi:histone deacetylase 3
VFEPVIRACVRKYSPSVLVMQCGADSLAQDRIGCFNLSIHGHGECVKYVKSFGIPMLVLGGGGYNIRNVSRCWAYETSILCDAEIGNEIPEDNRYYKYFEPDCVLHPSLLKRHENMNSKKYLDTVMGYVFENIERML